MKVTKKALKPYWVNLQELTDMYQDMVETIEQRMNSDLGRTDLEFFRGVDGYCGIGNLDRSMKLVQF